MKKTELQDNKKDSKVVLIPVILCGGAGSRLWPVSREQRPKPFIRLADGQSLLQKTWLRAAALSNVQEILTVANRDLFFQIEDEYREAAKAFKEKAVDSYILEPFGKNTAAAAAAAALRIALSHGEDALLLVLAADHLIADEKAFKEAVRQAMVLAEQGRLVTFGIRPESPETGYGYIEFAGKDVLRFIEKPSFEKAREYVSSGRFLWNSGMFCFSAKTLIREMENHCPGILACARDCLKKSNEMVGKGSFQVELDGEAFGRMPEESLDYAVMEKSRNVAVVSCDIGWNDIGSWSSMAMTLKPDAQGNRVQGEVLLHDASHCYIQGDGRVIAALGVKNLVIIDTPDALLVADRDRSQDVKRVYSLLKSRGHEVHKIHRTAHRPWGTYTVLEEGPGFKIKRIEVKPGKSLSLQAHQKRSEHWVVISGKAAIVRGEEEFCVNANESTFIPAQTKHRISNQESVPLILIEVQCGPYLGEDDIVRFQDEYGRVR